MSRSRERNDTVDRLTKIREDVRSGTSALTYNRDVLNVGVQDRAGTTEPPSLQSNDDTMNEDKGGDALLTTP